MRVLVELNPSIDGAVWAARHALGEVPDRVPYGLDRMEGSGHDVVVRQWPSSPAIRLAGRAAARAGGRMRWVESRLGRPTGASVDVRLCWDERIAVPALLQREGAETPLLAGVIWLTEPDARLPGPIRTATRRALRRADGLFLVSAAQVETLRRDWGIASDAMHVVNFGIDTDFWTPDADQNADVAAAAAPGARIVSVGNDRHRDHALLLGSLPDIHRRSPTARLDLVAAQKFDIPTAFGRRHAQLTHRQLRGLYQQSTVAVVSTHPNIHCSGLTATLEAMAMGLPVVVTDNPGMDEYIDAGRTGLRVPPGDQDALTEAVTALICDPDRAAEMGRAAQAEVHRWFSTQRQAAELAELVHKLR